MGDKYNGAGVETVWKRRKVKLFTGMFWTIAVCGVFFFACSFFIFSGEEVYEVLGFIGLIGFIFTAVYIAAEYIPAYKSNKNPEPALGLGADGALIIFKPGGGRHVIYDKITNVRQARKPFKLVFSLQRASGPRYIKTAKFIDDPSGAAARIRERFGLPGLAAEKAAAGKAALVNPFAFEGRNVFPVGERAVLPLKVLFLGLGIGAAVTFLTLLAAALIAGQPDFIATGAIITLSITALIIVSNLPFIINSFNKYPTIGLTEDGVIVIFKPAGGTVYLRDKILYVQGKPHITVISRSYKTRSGDTVTTTTYTERTVESWGKVIFTLRSASGAEYRKTARYVENCILTASQIRNMLE